MSVCKKTGPSYLTRTENQILVTSGSRKNLLNLENRRNLREPGVTGRSGDA
jgi:hypothetical protein